MVAFTLLAAIVVMYILQMIFPELTSMFWFDSSRALNEPWLFVTSIFLHGGLMHLILNGYVLFLFGSILEHKIKRDNFLLLFFGAGIAGSIAYYLTIILGIAPVIPALGASGAIYGILGALAFLLPNMRIFFFFFPMKMKHAAMIWIAIEFFGTFNTGSGIASAAHLGGLFFGILFAYYLKRKEKEDTSFYAYY